MIDRIRWKGTRSQNLWQRQKIIEAIRQDLYKEGFLEVETPLLVPGTCPDTHIESIKAEEGYLVTSTEYQIKRMIVGGFEKLFTLTKNFRAHDKGRYHSPEFTMLEWARVHESIECIEDDAVRFIRKAFHTLYPQQQRLQSIDMMGPWERISVRDAFKNHLGLENLEDFSLEPLLRACKQAGCDVPHNFQHDKYLVISYLFEQLQNYLGNNRPTFLREWPAYLTTSAPIDANDPFVATRSELYIAGIEIADGFPFLTDALLQKQLFEEAVQRRKELGLPEVRLDEAFLNSLHEGLPPGAGMALGIDRLVMILIGAESIAEVQAFGFIG